jgi:MOSC domain-containing protein YiiM
MNLSALPPGPADVGRLLRIVQRPERGARVALEHAVLDPVAGLPGDRWQGRFHLLPGRYKDSQISVMRADVLARLADRAGVSSDLAGDNLLVDLDLSSANLPVGSVVAIGEARLRVTPKRHTGCGKFRERFGPEGMRALKTLERARGLFLRVEVGGRVAVGDAIHVVERGPVGRRSLRALLG